MVSPYPCEAIRLKLQLNGSPVGFTSTRLLLDAFNLICNIEQVLNVMTDFVRDVQLDSAFGEIDLTNVFTGSAAAHERVAPVIAVPEQAVVAYNNRRADSAPALQAHYVSDGTVNLDYPYVTATDDSALQSAAADLYEVLRSNEHRTSLRELGFSERDLKEVAHLASRSVKWRARSAAPSNASMKIPATSRSSSAASSARARPYLA